MVGLIHRKEYYKTREEYARKMLESGNYTNSLIAKNLGVTNGTVTGWKKKWNKEKIHVQTKHQ